MLVNMVHDFGISLSYSDFKYLHQKWALDDLTVNRVCPDKLAENLLSIYLSVCLFIIIIILQYALLLYNNMH